MTAQQHKSQSKFCITLNLYTLSLYILYTQSLCISLFLVVLQAWQTCSRCCEVVRCWCRSRGCVDGSDDEGATSAIPQPVNGVQHYNVQSSPVTPPCECHCLAESSQLAPLCSHTTDTSLNTCTTGTALQTASLHSIKCLKSCWQAGGPEHNN